MADGAEIEGYERPYTRDEIARRYGEETAAELMSDPWHSWRAETGIELIHREPSEDELDRIWANWQMLPPELKDMSDRKSVELFGLCNQDHYDELKAEWEDRKDPLDEEERIADNGAYLGNMAKSFPDKAWFVKYVRPDVDTMVDFGGGAGDFCDFAAGRFRRPMRFVIIDNNPEFAMQAEAKGYETYESFDEFRRFSSCDPSRTVLNMSSVIHEVYSYADEFWDDVGVFWTDLARCGFAQVAIRDMSLSESDYRGVPEKAAVWVCENVLRDGGLDVKGVPLAKLLSDFEEQWGAVDDPATGKVDVKNLIHFLIKYRYVENWDREVRENYLPVSQDRLQSLLRGAGYSLEHKESSRLPYYARQWAKDFKLHRPDDDGYRREFLAWLERLNTHIKWMAGR